MTWYKIKLRLSSKHEEIVVRSYECTASFSNLYCAHSKGSWKLIQIFHGILQTEMSQKKVSVFKHNYTNE